VDQDVNVRNLLEADTPAISIFGKTWDLHVHRALGIDEETNLKLISETVDYLRQHGKEVIYDAEHFFDGYFHNPDFALRTLEAAKNAGARVLVLCDTNGGTITGKLVEAVAEVRKRFDGVIGIHPHNDADMAVANAIAAIEQGATHVQGTINGYGERCGNANLVSVIANLELKLGHTTIGPEKLQNLTQVARYVAELANLPMRNDQPYVGPSAFAHKGGVHVSAIMKDSSTYEHIEPARVGNRQRVLLSDMSGKGNILYKLEQHGLSDRLSEEARRELLDRIKHLEYEGYELEAAEGTFELLVREALNPGLLPFEVLSYEVGAKMIAGKPISTLATVIIRANGGTHSETASGDGPVNALDNCLRKCLAPVFPAISDVRLTDYKVRVLDGKRGTGSKVRVLVGWSDHKRSWSTVGVSENIIEASWLALVDALRLEVLRLADQDQSIQSFVEDYSWGV
jgi:2-isopropylmalate synthase